MEALLISESTIRCQHLFGFLRKNLKTCQERKIVTCLSLSKEKTPAKDQLYHKCFENCLERAIYK